MPDPLISVIVTIKNGARFLPAALASIRRQAYVPLEIIVVDGHSTDATERIARAVDGLRYVRQVGDGLANARNQGIREGHGELIAFLDADDEWIAGKLRRQVDYLLAHPHVGGTIAWLHFLIEPRYSKRMPGIGRYYKKNMIGYTPGTLVAWASLLRKVGPFAPEYVVACDADWFARMLDSNQPVDVLPDVLLNKRIHGSNMSLDRDRVRRETMAVMRNSLQRKRGLEVLPYLEDSELQGWDSRGSHATPAEDVG